MNTTIQFTIGQIVHHRRYDYRGVIVDIDDECLAEEGWYNSNQTKPERGQPWYHVLVDGGRETYVAQENIELDAEGIRVDHPLVDRFFPTFQAGRYYRQSFN